MTAGFRNLGDLIPRDRDLSKIAIVDLGGEQGPREFSFAQIDAMANGVARALERRGLRRGDRVAILSANRAEYIAAYYGIMRSGFVAVPVNFKFPRETIHFILRDAGAKLVFCDATRAADCPDDIARVIFGASSLMPSSTMARSMPSCRPRMSRRCFSTPPVRPARPKASCCRIRVTSGWSRRGSRPASIAIVI